MVENRNKLLKKQIGLSFVFQPLSILISYITIPLMLNYLGDTRYGIWMTLLSILSWVNYFDIGIGNGLKNKLTESLANNCFSEAKKYISTAYVIISVISISVLFVIEIGSFFLPWSNIFNSKALSNRDFILFIELNFFLVIINFITSLIKQMYLSIHKASAVGLIQLCSQALSLIGVIILNIYFEQSLLLLSIVYSGSIMITNIIFTWIFFKANSGIKPSFKDFEGSKVQDLAGIGVKFFVIQIGALVMFTTDNMVITQLFGPEEVTPYNLALKLFQAIIMIHSIVITPLWPAFTEAYVKKDTFFIKKTIRRLNYFTLFLGFIAVIFILFSKFFFKLWLNEVPVFPAYLILFLGIYSFVSNLCNNYAYILNATNKINIQLIVAVTQAIINIPLSVFFARNLNFGVSGVMLGTILSLSLSLVIYPIVAKKIIDNIQ